MATVKIIFPSPELANLFASTMSGGEFRKFMNELSKQADHHEMLEEYLDDTVEWDENEQGNHEIDLSNHLQP